MDDNLLILGLGLGFLVVVVPAVGLVLHYRRERTLLHAERMKALELGRELPLDAAAARIQAAAAASAAEDDNSRGALARKCFSTALWVAFWGFGAGVGMEGVKSHAGVAYAIAAATGAIGVTAVICGAILAIRAPIGPAADRSSKPAIEDDAFDVVSRRG